MLKVVIVGAGALGKCIAGVLAEQVSITMFKRSPDNRQVRLQGSFIFKENKSIKEVRVHTAASMERLQGEKIDALVFATKIMDLRKAVNDAKGLFPRCVFFPQNGIFDFDWTKHYFKKAQICRGVTTMACQEIGPAEVELFYRGNMYLGGDGAKFLADLFRKAGVGAKAYRHSDGPVWAKLIFSAVMNPLPVVTGQGYDILKKDKEIWKLVSQAIQEGRAVARALDVRLSFDPLRLIDRVRNGDLAGIKHRGSIVHDMIAGRSTELDFITGALVRQARKVSVKTPALEFILAKAEAAGA